MRQLHRLQNDTLGRLLHNLVYQRIIKFCEQYTPELPAQVVADTWMQRVYNSDKNLYIMLDLDSQYNILGHAVIDVQDQFGYRVVHCYQIQGEKKSVAALDFGAEYLDKLAAEVGAACTVFYVKDNVKALEKRYGYHAVRTVMLKYYTDTQQDNDNG